MANGFAPPRRFRAQGDLRKTLEINFRFLGNWLNDTFGQAAYTPPFVPYAPRIWRGSGDLLPILNKNWRYTVTYINTFVQAEPVLAGIQGFASWPPFRGTGTDTELPIMVKKNFNKLVNYLNNEIAPNL